MRRVVDGARRVRERLCSYTTAIHMTRGRNAALALLVATSGGDALRPALSAARGNRRLSAQTADGEELSEYDVIEFARDASDPEALEVGVALRDGRVQPLCCWDADQDPVELVWDEEVEPLADVHLCVGVVDAWPSTRLVDGGLGPNNPHGEESEDVFIVDRSALDPRTVVVVRADREVWW